MQKRIREAMSGSDGLLKGIVEVDESYIGGSMTNAQILQRRTWYLSWWYGT